MAGNQRQRPHPSIPSSRRSTRTVRATGRCCWRCCRQRPRRTRGQSRNHPLECRTQTYTVTYFDRNRLAALDNLQAEQLRAYSSHLAVFGSASGAHLQPLHIPYQQSQYPMHRDLSRSPALTSRSSDDGAEEEQPKTPVEPTEPSASSLSSHKRKRSTQEEGAFDSARRISPAFSAADRTPLLPSTASQPTPPQSLRRSISPSSSSLRHLLNEELRPFSNGRARTSEMRTSASDEDEE